MSRRRIFNDDLIERLRTLCAEHRSLYDISVIMGISYNTLVSWCTRFGIKRCGKPGPRTTGEEK